MLTLDNLNWEAVATFTAGIAAVAGAVVIGFRQAAILDRQVEIEQLKVKTDLFDKRFSTYVATADFLTHVHPYMEDPTKAKVHDWLLKCRESQFLFDAPVYENLREVFDKANEYYANHTFMITTFKQTGTYDPERSDREMASMIWLANRLQTVHEIFEPDLKLTIPQARRSSRWRNLMRRRD